MKAIRDLLRGKLARNSAAVLLGDIAKTFVTLATVPVFSYAWGLTDYGVWLILFTIPGYLGYSDLGITFPATNQMIDAAERGDLARARSYFRAAWVITGTVALVAATVLAAIVLAIPNLLQFAEAATGGQAAWVLAALAGYGIAALMSMVVYGGFRGTRRFVCGTNYVTAIASAELIAAMAVALIAGSQLAVAITLLAVRVAGLMLTWWELHRGAPWLAGKADRSPRSLLGELWGKALSTFAVAMGMGLTLQGAVMAVGAAGGPAIVPVFSATRTLARFIPQLATSVGRGSMPLVTSAVARGEQARARQLAIGSVLVATAISLPAALVVSLFGPWIISLWSGGVIQAPWEFVALMGFAGAALGPWSVAFNVQLAVNRHARFAAGYVLLSLIGIAALFAATRQAGLVGAGWATLGVELATAMLALFTLWRAELYSLADLAALAVRFGSGKQRAAER